MPGTSSKSLMRGSKWVRRSIYSLARFLSQHGFSCAAVQEEQLRLCVFKAFQLNSDPIKWYHQRSGFCLVVHSFHVSVNLWGPLFSFSSLKIWDPNSNRSLLTILAGPFTFYHPTGFLQLLRHLGHTVSVPYTETRKFFTLLGELKHPR